MKRSGFTLVELLVAISILGMVAVLGWRGLDGIVRARIALTEQMEATRGMQLAFAQMQSDCDYIPDAALIQNRPTLQTANDRITLVRTAFVENEPTRLQVVSYRIVNGVLTRRESLGTRDLVQLDVLWQAAVSDADPTPAVPLQANLAGMQVLLWQNNAWRAIPTAAPNVALPTAVSGVQVALQAQGQEAPMVKSFLLGGL